MNTKELLLSFAKFCDENFTSDMAFNIETETKVNRYLSTVVTEIEVAPNPMRYFWVSFTYNTDDSSGQVSLTLPPTDKMPSADYVTAIARQQAAIKNNRPESDFTFLINNWIELTEEDYFNFIKK
jgi:hypothetical protein